MSDKPVMDRERWLAVSPYLDQAFDLPPEQLEPWLQQLELSAPHIATDVRRLLTVQHADPFSSFLTGVVTQPPDDAQSLHEGELLGSYRVLRELGHGGMAVVYLAERADGHFEQQVALKILRFASPGGEARRHFAQERQILASLNHPAIARLIDGGITPSGLPYLAMEYVDGTRIDRYCDERRLSIEDRLRLFLKVAEAVQYAHRRLIVHRDLKPTNIFITSDGAVKLLDFGIAKLLDPQAIAHAAPPTLDVIKLMTPEYASPEQVRGDAITTATDIYQLGLLLYELLTGQRPYEVQGHKALEALRVICESEPMRPSDAVSGKPGTHAESPAAISAARATTPERLRRLLRSDLHAIVLMALRKEPERRYGSVALLMEDITRYLEGRPVNAYKGVWSYRAGKFLRRNAAGVTVAVIAACAFAFVVLWYTIQLANERDRVAAQAERAQREAATASQVSAFLTSLLRGSRTRVAKSVITARELLDLGAARIDTQLAGQPEIQGRLLNVIGDAYAQHDVRDKAAALLERALKLNTERFGERSKEVSDSKYALAQLARSRGEFDTALQLYREALDIREDVLGTKHVETADVLNGMGTALEMTGQTQEAVRTAERALSIYRQSIHPEDERFLNVLNTIAGMERYAGNLRRARTIYEELVPRVERSLGPEHRHFAGTLTNLARTKVEMGAYDGVEQQMRQALAIFESLHGPVHSDVTLSLTNLGSFLTETDRFTEAIDVIERAIAVQRKVSGPGDPFEATAHALLGRVRQAQGNYQGALDHYRASLDIRRKQATFRYGIDLRYYAETLMDLSDPDRAAPLLQEAIDILRKELPRDHYVTAGALALQGALLTRMGKAAAAEPQLRAALSVLERTLLPTHPSIASARAALGECLLAQGRVREGEVLLLESARQLEGRLNPERRQVLHGLRQLYEIKGDTEAGQRVRDALDHFERQVRAQ
jgi:serine/threonine-protein kinase